MITRLRPGRAVLSVAAAAALSAGAASYSSAAAAVASLTNADNARTVAVHLGDTVQVRLTPVRGDGVQWVWNVPTASDPGLLARATGSAAPDGGAAATFEAQEAGSGSVTAQAVCRPTAPGARCPAAAMSWNVTVDVQ
ncbi:hypothetical protein [Streptomyces beihaiensis]|uniref:Proteinase inhibitor I42 chagasin domain-containing protein n=1 Tax=Streptomyces beihaiensis TaxID=2984495 RepID=A0ABT3TVP7_9ACTN|nr:hypothetical protein [Streptomyces beihaiensis]MCX3061129.1 hypothetical protein [Streptomyces beihaiensis]